MCLPSNQQKKKRFWTSGISGDIRSLSTSFPHPCDPSRVVHTVIDPPHIFKCIRNNLLKVGKFLLPGDQEVFHFHYSALLEYEEQQAGLRAVPKLTRAHVHPNPFQKLSVKLAVQLFSESTASGMEFYAKREECKKLHTSAPTVEFTRRMNTLFDCLNTKRPQQVQYNEAEHITTLQESIEWLDKWQEYIQTLPKQRQICFLSRPTCEALRLTLHSVVALVEYLLKSGFKYVLVGNFGQDPLERFFGITRHVAGDGGQPTVQQFLFIYRMLSVNNIVQPPKRAPVDCERPNLLLKLQDISCKKAPTTNQADTLAVLFDDILLEPADDEEVSTATSQPLTTKQNILDYLGGYVVKKFSRMTCAACIKTLKTSSRQPSDLTAAKSKGYLQVPSARLLGLLQVVEDHVERFTVEKVASGTVYMDIIESILSDDRTVHASVGCQAHFVATTAEIVYFFLRCRLHFLTREKNKASRATKRPVCPASGGKKPGD